MHYELMVTKSANEIRGAFLTCFQCLIQKEITRRNNTEVLTLSNYTE